MSARLASAAAVAALALVPYLQTLEFGPTYDDHHHVVDNAFLQDASNVALLFSAEYLSLEIPDQGRPVLLASLLADRALFGDSFAGAHAQSALWHVLVSLMVLWLAWRLGAPPAVAAGGAALFALHPACVEAVAGVSNREDPLAAFFVLVALWAASRLARGSWAWLALVFVAFALALGAKEVAVVAPALFVLLAAAVPAVRPSRARAAALAGVGAAAMTTWAAFQVALGVPSLSIGAGAGPLTPLSIGLGWSPLASATRLHDLGWQHAAPVLAHRVGRLAIGWPLSAEHDLDFVLSPGGLVIGGAVLLALVAAGLLLWREHRGLAVAAWWLLVASVPTLASPWLLNPVADRYLYLPAVGVCAGLGIALAAPRDPRWPRLLLLGLLAFFGARAIERASVWRDDVTLFDDAARNAPRSARAWQNLGAAHLSAGDTERAILALERALELDPARKSTHLNLGIAHLRRGDRGAGLRALESAIEAPTLAGERPLHDRAFDVYARQLERLGRRDTLRAAVARELARSPDSPPARAWQLRLE